MRKVAAVLAFIILLAGCGNDSSDNQVHDSQPEFDLRKYLGKHPCRTETYTDDNTEPTSITTSVIDNKKLTITNRTFSVNGEEINFSVTYYNIEGKHTGTESTFIEYNNKELQDENGNKIGNINIANEIITKHYIDYDSEGNVITVENLFISGMNDHRKTYFTYDNIKIAGNQLPAKKVTYVNGVIEELSNFYQINYDTLFETIYSQGYVRNKIIYFDVNGNVIKEIHYRDSVFDFDFIIFNEYNALGLLVKSFTKNKEGTYGHAHGYEYDQYGNLVKRYFDYENDGVYEYEHERLFEYDTIGNIIKAIDLSAGGNSTYFFYNCEN